MNRRSSNSRFRFLFLSLVVLLQLSQPFPGGAQAIPYARTFSRSKEEVDAALKGLQAYAGQKLPVVDGFVAMGEQPLDRYERAFYQFSIELVPDISHSTVVKLTAKITAWYADPDPAKAGYQVLPSNGRLELDLLDRLSEKFGDKPAVYVPRSTLQSPRPKIDSSGNPLPESSTTIAGVYNSPAETPSAGAASIDVASLKLQRETEQKRMLELKAELESLQEVQHNQAYPRNLVIVNKSGSAVLARPVEGSKVLFTASVDDEFELIEVEGEWFHVQIAGVSRGWIRRSQAESMDPRWNAPVTAVKAEAESASIFKVTREESGPFPGDWTPLKNMTVKIFWVQPAASPATSTESSEKREFTKLLFQRAWNDAKGAQAAPAGVVVVFDTPDGGEASATMAVLRDWMERKIAEAQFWKECSVDPPELFSASPKP